MADLFLRAAAVLIGLSVLGALALLWVRAQSVAGRSTSAVVVPVPRAPGLEARRERRVPVRLLASWEGLEGRLSTVDISRAGCCLRGTPVPEGEGTLTLWMPGALPRWRRPAVVRWRADAALAHASAAGAQGDSMCGVAFLDDGEAPAEAWDDLFREHAALSTRARRIVVAVADGRPSTAAIVNDAVEAGRHASAIGQLYARLGELLHEGNTLEVRDALRRTLAVLEAQAATTLEARIVDLRAAAGAGADRSPDGGVLEAAGAADADVVLCDATDVVTLAALRAQRGDAERPLLAGVGVGNMDTGVAPAGQPAMDLLLLDERDVRELLSTVRTLLARAPTYGARASTSLGAPTGAAGGDELVGTVAPAGSPEGATRGGA